MKRLFAATVMLSLLPAAHAFAQDIEVGKETGDVIGEVADVVGGFKLSNLPAELHVTADRMEFNYKAGRLLYEGNVDITHGEIRMKADNLVLTFEPEQAEELKEINANGDVEVVRGDEVARGQNAVYTPGESLLRLTGSASLGSGPNVVRGESVVVYLDEGRAVVEGGRGPVRARIEPKSFEDEEFLN